MSILYIVSGIPGSGKSTFVKEKVAANFHTVVLSTDNFREQFTSSPCDWSKDKEVWKTIYKNLENPKPNMDYIVDATNLTIKRCKTYLKYRKQFDKIILVKIDTPLEVAKIQNASRERKVPENVIDEMYATKMENYYLLDELGFDTVISVKSDGIYYK